MLNVTSEKFERPAVRLIVIFKSCFLWLVGICICSHPAVSAEFDILPGLIEGQQAILIRGAIEPGDDETFYKLAQKAEHASIILESPGGSVDVGISIGAEIAIRGFTTLVLDGEGCYSICAVIWVSGVRRYMSPKAAIGVHAAYRLVDEGNGEVQTPESGVANAKIGAYLNEIGLSRDAIEYFTLARPNEPLMPITPEIAQMLDLDVFIQDGLEITTPEERPTPRRITRQVTEYAGLSGNCSELFSVNIDFWSEQAKINLKEGHNLFGGEIFAQLIAEYSDKAKADIAKNGFVHWCISAEANLRADHLPTGLTGPSFDCLKLETSTESAICSSDDLWAMDRAMANLYFFFRNSDQTNVSSEFLASQRNWLKRRDACGSNVDCLLERYSSRLFDFGA